MSVHALPSIKAEVGGCGTQFTTMGLVISILLVALCVADAFDVHGEDVTLPSPLGSVLLGRLVESQN